MWIVCFILLIACIGLAIWGYQEQHKNKEVQSLNESIKQQNEQLEEEYQEHKKKIEGIRETLKVQENILQSVRKSTEIATQQNEEYAAAALQHADENAQKLYEERITALTEQYKKEMANYREKLQSTIDERATEQSKVDDLKAKQLAYLEEQARQEKMAAELDYWRLALTDIDINDIQILRNVQLQLVHKDAIDKVLWSVYIKPAYDVLCSHLFTTSAKVCGIYRITCTTNGKMYVGQSVDIKERFSQHIKAGLSYNPASNALYREMQKQGVWNFTFEVLEEVPRPQLNERESYYIDFYKTKELGLNGTKGNG